MMLSYLIVLASVLSNWCGGYMDLNETQQPDLENSPRMDPKVLLDKIEFFTDEVGKTFKGILGSLLQLQDDIRQLDQLKEVALVAEQMLSGEHRSHLNVQAKGEVGKLVGAINQTLDNLQQLDKTVHEETGKVPELAQHLDHITEETEAATGQVLEKLDLMIEGSEKQDQSMQEIKEMVHKRLEMDRENKASIDNFLESLNNGENQEQILQEALDFVALMGQQASEQLQKSELVDQAIVRASERAEENLNHAFDIMNLLQFQDITRQKVSKVIGLLKEMQSGLYRLLEIFNIQSFQANKLVLTEKQKATQDKILDRQALVGEEDHTLSVDDIIRNFKNS